MALYLFIGWISCFPQVVNSDMAKNCTQSWRKPVFQGKADAKFGAEGLIQSHADTAIRLDP
jgi:hypothetical protein